MDTLPEHVKEQIFQAIGRASMCWDPIPEGIFDSTQAGSVGEELCKYIHEHMTLRED